MLRSKIRIASLTAAVLFALVAAYPSITFLRTDAQESNRPDTELLNHRIERWASGLPDKLKGLLEERLATAIEFEKMVTVRVMNNEGTLEELMEANRLAHDAALQLCDSDKARVAVLESYLAKTKNNEATGLRAAKTGQGRASTALWAKAQRLGAEIALIQVKNKTDAAPDAKVKVKKGNQPGRTTQPAEIQAYESVNLYAKVPGFLKKQTVDIGDRVKSGQVLAVVDTPELESQLKHDRAALDKARARLQRARARISRADADLETAKLSVLQADEMVKSAAASVRYSDLKVKRLEVLFKNNSIEAKILDEAKDRHEVAVGERSAKAAVATAKSQVVAAKAKIEEAKADVAIEEAGVVAAQANLEKSQVLLSSATISAPFDGVITQRHSIPGDFIRTANQGGNEPLLTVQRVDKMRVIVAIPDRDVPFVDAGDAVELEIDALPGRKWSAKVSRIASFEDPKTRTMRVEIDLPNPTGHICSGMYGRVTIVFEKRNEK